MEKESRRSNNVEIEKLKKNHVLSKLSKVKCQISNSVFFYCDQHNLLEYKKIEIMD